MAEQNDFRIVKEVKEEAPKKSCRVKCGEDSCWKWLVVSGCVLVNFTMEGSFSAFGVIYTDLCNYFQDTKSNVAWVGSLFFSLPLVGGAVASLIAVKFGCRFATILGGLIASLGIIASAFVTSIEIMYLTFGCITGLAYSLPYVASALILSHYFNSKLGLVNGIAECGASLGSVVVPILFEESLSTYGWRGTQILSSGLTLNMLVCGSLFRPVYKNITDTRRKEDETTTWIVEMVSPESKNLSLSAETKDVTYSASPDMQSADIKDGEYAVQHNTLSTERKDGPHAGSRSAVSHDTPTSISLKTSETQENTRHVCPSKGIVEGANLSTGRDPRADGIPCSSRTPSEEEVKSSNNSDETRNIKVKLPWCKTCISALRLDIYSNSQFVCYTLIMFVVYLWIDVPYVYYSDRAIELGISRKNSALLLSMIGILQLFGNIIFGYVGDNKRFDNVIVFGITVILSGLTLAFVPFFTTFGPLAALAGGFGFFTAAVESMCSVMLVEFLSVGNLGVGYGYSMVIKGLSELIGPPFAGWLYDISGRYDNTFYVAGGTMAACGLIYTPVAKVLAKCSKRKQEMATLQN